MSHKLGHIFDILLELDECRFDESVTEYIKIHEIDRRNCSAFLTANKEGVELVKKRFKELNTSVTITETSWFTEVNVGNFKLLDIGI